MPQGSLEELHHLQKPGSHVEEVVKQMEKNSSRKKIIWGGFKQGF
jgi:hypothetical protein